MRLYLFYIPNVDSFPICLGAEANNSLQQLVALRAATVAILSNIITKQRHSGKQAWLRMKFYAYKLRLHKVLHKISSSPEAKS